MRGSVTSILTGALLTFATTWGADQTLNTSPQEKSTASSKVLQLPTVKRNCF